MSLIRLAFPLLLFLLTLQNTALARKTQYLSLHATKSLDEHVRYNRLSVVDRRTDTADFGLFKGLYSYFALVTKRPFETELASLDSSLFGLSQRVDGELLIVLYDHRFMEAQDKLATLTLHADFFLRGGGEGNYRHIYTADSFYEAFRNKTLPDGLFAEAWQRCLQMAIRQAMEADDTRRYTIDEAIRREDAARQQHPVYRATSYPAGVYYSWEEFLHLQPGTPEVRVRRIENNVMKPYAFYIPDGTKKRGSRELEEADFFAAYDGKQWYKTSDRRIYVMQREEDGNFYYPGVQAGLVTQSSKGGYVASAAIVGGVIGMLVVAAVLHDVDKKNEHRDNVLYRLRLGLDGRGVPVSRKD